MAAAAVTQGLGSGMKQHFNKYKLCDIGHADTCGQFRHGVKTVHKWDFQSLLHIMINRLSMLSSLRHTLPTCLPSQFLKHALLLKSIAKSEQINAFKMYTKHGITSYMMFK